MADFDFDTMDFFTNPAFVPDPQPYFDHLRDKGRVVKEPHHGVVAVTGYTDTLEVFKDAELWSNCVAVGGPFPPLPFTPEGDDISDQIDGKMQAIGCYESQFVTGRSTEFPTALDDIRDRARAFFGQDAEVVPQVQQTGDVRETVAQ